jgi:hypothetical protein
LLQKPSLIALMALGSSPQRQALDELARHHDEVPVHDLLGGHGSEHVVGASSLTHFRGQDTIGKWNGVAEAGGIDSGTSPVLELLWVRLLRFIGCLAKGGRDAKDDDQETGKHDEVLVDVK